MYKSKHFKLYELLPKELYKNEEDNEGWKLLDSKLLEIIDKVRELVNVPLICNNWKHGGSRNNCGYRDINSSVGTKLSQHKLGRACDLISNKITAEEMRKIIKDNAKELPHSVRIESGVSWLHIDVKPHDKGKILYFNP